MKLRRHKRGFTMEGIITLSFAAAVILLMLSLGHRYGTEDQINQFSIAKDMSLLVDTVQSSPGQVYLTSQRNFETQTVQLQDNRFLIGEVYGTYVSSHEMFFQKLISPSTTYLVKREDGVFVSEDISRLPGGTSSLSCPTIDTKGDIQQTNILLDPQHGGIDPGITGEPSEATLVGNMAQTFASAATGETIELTRSVDIAEEASVSPEGRAAKKAGRDIILSLGTGQHVRTDVQHLWAYIPTGESMQRSQKLACHILNEISQKFSVQSVGILPIDLEENKDSQFTILSSQVPSVMLELGNMAYAGKEESLLKDPTTLGKLTYDGVMSYLS